MAITFNGTPIQLQDPDGELDNFINQFQNIQDVVNFCLDEGNIDNPRNAPVISGVGTGVNSYNYPDLPIPKLNTLVWPTGATRWGYFLALVRSDASLPTPGQGVGTLTISSIIYGNGAGSPTISPQMYVLANKPITKLVVSSVAPIVGLNLLVLVDVRYFWQYTNVGSLFSQTNQQVTWSDITSKIQSALATSISFGAIPSGMGLPDTNELVGRTNHNAAQLLDAVAGSLGQRIVLQYNGIATSTTSGTSFNENFSDLTLLMAGGVTDGEPQPNQFSVSFPKLADHHPYCNGDQYLIQNTLGHGANYPTQPTYYSTMFADYTIDPETGNPPSTPNNSKALTALAQALQNVYVGWFGSNYDATFHGVQPWTFTGYDNYVEVICARLVDKNSKDDKGYKKIPTYQFQTRAVSMPANFGTFINLSQDANLLPIITNDCIWGKFTGTTFNSDNGTGVVKPNTVEVYDLSMNNTDTDSGYAINAYSVLGAVTLTKGDKCICLWNCSDNRWILFGDGADSAIVQVSGNSQSSAIGSGVQSNSQCVWGGLIVTPTGKGIQSTLYCSGVYPGNKAIWLVAVDVPGGSSDPTTTLLVGDNYIGKLIGNYSVGSDTRPLYAIRAGTNPALIRFELLEDLNFGQSTAQAIQLVWDGNAYVEFGDPFFVVDWTTDNTNGNYSTWVGLGVSGAISGYQGLCQYQTDRQVYEIVWMENVARFIQFKLTEALDTQTNIVQANVIEFWNGRNPALNETTVKVYNLPSKVSSGKPYEFSAPANAMGYGVYDESKGDTSDLVYWIFYVEPYAHMVHFATTTLMNGQAQAKVLYYDLGVNPDPMNTGITVYDQFNQWINSPINATGTAFYDDISNKYRVINMQATTEWVLGKLTGPLANDGTGSMTIILSFSSVMAGVDMLGTVQLIDPLGQFSGPNSLTLAGQNCMAVWSQQNNRYIIVWLSCGTPNSPNP